MPVKSEYERADADADPIVRILDLSDEYLDQHAALSSALNQALFSLSQAKYIMGCDRVGPVMYDYREVPAGLGVHIQPGSGRRQSGDVAKGSGLVFAAVASPCIPDDPQDRSCGRIDRDTPVQRRAGASAATDQMQDETRPVEDPLKWFGLLPQESLRKAQKEFRSVVCLAVRLAAVVHELGRAEQEISNAL